MAPLPIAKLASLLIKTLAKPMSKKVKLEFSRYETTQNILVAIGQSTHSLTSRMKIWSEGYVVRSIKPLDRETAMTGGSEFVGEAFLFSVAGGLVVWEYNKKAEEDMVKKAKAAAVTRRVEERIRALEERTKIIIERSEKDSPRNNTGLTLEPSMESPQDTSRSARRWWPL